MTRASRALKELIRPIRPLYSLAKSISAKRAVSSAFSNRKVPPVLIYQMGKVGSSSVYRSLLNASLPNTVLHLHYLGESLQERKDFRIQRDLPLPYHFYVGENILDRLSTEQDFPVKIISLVRDPIAVLVSNLFENPNFVLGSCDQGSGKIDPEKAGEYLSRKLQDPQIFSRIDEWFDKEIKTSFGINVFETEFPTETGYAFYAHGSSELMVIRLEDLSEKGPQALAEFLGLKDPLIVGKENVRSVNTAYEVVRSHISLSCSTCHDIYSGRLTKHFYSDAQIEKFTAKWTKQNGLR